MSIYARTVAQLSQSLETLDQAAHGDGYTCINVEASFGASLEENRTVVHLYHHQNLLRMATPDNPDPSSSSGTQARPTAHAQRYDRQLRLWASSGQASLEGARLAVLGASYLGASVLKNLVLPGIGSFDLIDARNVEDADLGSNFFVRANAKGKGRAQEVTENLCELNPDVRGSPVTVSSEEWVQQTDMDAYTLIIAVNQPRSVLRPLAEKAWEAKAGVGVPLMAVRGCGLVGEITLQVKELGIIETHPENTIDLRITKPWPELEAFAKSYDMTTSDSLEHSHIPYIVLLIDKLNEWKKGHEGQLPVPAKDRKPFLELINRFRWGDQTDEENIDEAIGALGQYVWRPIAAGNQGLVPDEIATLFQDQQCSHITSLSSNFWILVRALREFCATADGTLPLPGSLPDMKSQSSTYVKLQRLYREKAKSDVERLRQIIDGILANVGLPIESISDAETESFAKHAAYLKLIRGRRLAQLEGEPDTDTILNAFQDPINPITVPWHIALVAAQDFYSANDGRYPGSTHGLSANLSGIVDSLTAAEEQGIFEQDQASLFDHARALLTKWKLRLDDDQMELVQNACVEITRAGHADLPSTSALLGGTAAQEAIKLITRQYVPLDNTVIYDGIKQAIGAFRL